MRELFRRQKGWVVLAGVSACIAATGCQATTSRAAVLRVEPAASSALGQPLPALPANYTEPDALVGDPSGSGAWFVAQSNTQISLFRWTFPSTLSSWDLGAPGALGGIGLDPPIAVSADSTNAWVGIQSNIYHVDVATGAVTSFPAPLTPESSLAAASLPTGLRSDRNVLGLAAAPDGNLAVVTHLGSDVSIVSPSGSLEGNVPLPSDTVASAAVYDSAGYLALPLLSYPGGLDDSLLTVSASGVSSDLPIPASFVSTDGSSFITGGAAGVFSVAPADLPLSAASIVDPESIGAPQQDAPLVGSPIFMVGSSVLFATRSGLAVTSSSGSAARYISFPSYNCSGASVPPGNSAEQSTSADCDEFATSLSVDGAGDVVYELSGSSGGIYYMTPAMLQNTSSRVGS